MVLFDLSLALYRSSAVKRARFQFLDNATGVKQPGEHGAHAAKQHSIAQLGNAPIART
ncbi:MAG: hypothetical protein ACREDJ_00915 [Methylocella sp.]